MLLCSVPCLKLRCFSGLDSQAAWVGQRLIDLAWLKLCRLMSLNAEGKKTGKQKTPHKQRALKERKKVLRIIKLNVKIAQAFN